MKYVHMTIQGKGGVGKTFISYLVVQYLRNKLEDKTNVNCYDLDPINCSLSLFKALNVKEVFKLHKDKKQFSHINTSDSFHAAIRP